MNLKPIDTPLQFIPVYFTKLGEYQAKVYEFIIQHLRNKSNQITDLYGSERAMPNFENMDTFGYTLLQQPIESLNIVFPSSEFDNMTQEITNIEENQRAEIIKNTVGKQGLSHIMTYKTLLNPRTNERTRSQFEYIPQVLSTYGRIFSPAVLPKYSSKISKICQTILQSKGIVLIHSQYIDGGVVPIALALEEMGFSRYSHSPSTKSLFRSPPTELLDSLTMKPKSQISPPSAFLPARYVMITGDKSFSPNNAADMKYITSPTNRNGEQVKVILITKAGSEGLDFKNIRQVHILEPWYNMSRIDQIVGRAVRNFSHCKLPFEERNVQIYLHASLPKNDEEPADLYVYRFAEKKAVQIGKVTRLLKQIAVDCVLNIGQTQLTMEELSKLAENQNIRLRLSSSNPITGEPRELDYLIGDRAHSDVCDYMDCHFTCSPNSAPIDESAIIKTTYNDTFLKTNYETLSKRIRQLFKEQAFYKRDDLFAQINLVKQYPVEQIDYALTRLLTYSEEHLTDQYGRSGNLINRGEYYAFQPTEITDEYASLLERMAPVEYKPTNLVLQLPKKAPPLEGKLSNLKNQQEEEEEEETNMSSLEDDYAEIYKELVLQIQYITADTKIESGETDWYKSLANVYKKLTDYHTIPPENIRKYAIYHFLDVLPFAKRMIVLRWLNRDTLKLDDEIEQVAKQYFEEKRVDKGGNNYKVVLLFVSEKKQNKIIVPDIRLFRQDPEELTQWTPVASHEYLQYQSGVSTFHKKPADYANIVGFMAPFKEGEIVFKMKDVNERRNNFGVDCQKAGRKDVMGRLNTILGEPVYNDTFIKQRILKKKDGKIVKDKNGQEIYEDNGIFNNGLCVILELLLRYYQETKPAAVWFFDVETAIISQIAKYKRAA
jgi:hypothetical protein